MKVFRPHVRALLLLESALFLAAGTFYSVRSESIPCGRYWPVVLAATIAGAGLSFWLFVLYQGRARGLVRGKRLKLAVAELPQQKGHTYVGKGFVWGPAQTELLGDLLSGPSLPSAAMDDLAGDWRIHGVGVDREENLFLPNSLLNQHIFLMGAPGSGKTRGLEFLIEQAVERGDALVVIDPKGDEALLDRTYDSTVRHNRSAQFRVIALPYPYKSSRYNPLQSYLFPSDVADRLVAPMPNGGDSKPFRDFAYKFVHIVARAIDALGERPSLIKIENYCFHNTWLLVRLLLRKYCPDLPLGPDLKQLLNSYRTYCVQHRQTFPVLDQLIAMASMDSEHFAKVSGMLSNLLSKLTSQSVGYILCPEDVEVPEPLRGQDAPPTVSWETIDRERLVVYFYLGSLIAPDSANATARMCLADLASYVGRKYAFDEASDFAKRRMTVVVDEMGDALAPESVNILNKARGAGLSMVMAAQSLADLETALGRPADARRALANMGTFLILRAANPDDAKFFTEKVGVRPLPVVTRGERYEPALFGSGRRDIADFAYQSSTSTSTRNDYLLPTSALDRLARGHFFGLWAGELRKGMFPELLDPPANVYSTRLKREDPTPATTGAPLPVAAPAVAPENPPAPVPVGEGTP